MSLRDADIRRRILERRAAFLSASLAAVFGCSAPQTLSPLPQPEPSGTGSPPDADAGSSSAAAMDSSVAALPSDAGADRACLDAPAPLDAQLVVVRVCLSIILLPGVGFAPYGTHVVSGQDTVDEVANVMRERTEASVEVQGHADAIEGDQSGRLSRKRAELVVAQLVSRGVARERLCIKAFGSSRPLEANDTPPHRARNRRVEFRKMDGGETCEPVAPSSGAPPRSPR